MKSSTFFSGALSKANTVIAQAKNDPKYQGDLPIDVLEEKIALSIYPQLVNIELGLLFSSFAKCGLAYEPTDQEMPMSMRVSVLILVCELVMKEALALPFNDFEPSDKTYQTARIVWFSNEFKANKKVKVVNTDGAAIFKTAEELEAEASDGCVACYV